MTNYSYGIGSEGIINGHQNIAARETAGICSFTTRCNQKAKGKGHCQGAVP